ncbi:response regulator [Paenibacillus sp. NPDC058071]|uniref:response regulator n=1 Tax=Paenibacillus sp. NPDC058071 TaxID=3346326 RepID=UPI0036D9E116
MRVLLVDDEQHVREAIRLLIDWEELGVTELYEADNGNAAAQLIERDCPEIVITDMRMPHRDGVELLSWLHAGRHRCKTIVVSGYDDFELVRSSMKYGGLDYLLKPIDPEQLREALQKAVLSWESEERARRVDQQRNMEMNQIKPVYWDKLFSGLIGESGVPALPVVLKEEFDLSGKDRCLTAILSTTAAEQAAGNRFRNNRDLLNFAVINVCNEFLRAGNQGFAFRYWNSENEIVLLLWDGLDAHFELFASIREGLERIIPGRFLLGIGREQPFPAGARVSYREASVALKQRNVLAASEGLYCFQLDHKLGLNAVSLSQFEERFLVAALSGKEKDICAAADSWIGALEQQPTLKLEQLELHLYEYEMLLNRLIHERLSKAGEDKAANWKYDRPPLQQLLDDDGKLDLAAWKTELVRGLTALSAQAGSDRGRDSVMLDIAKYMEQNYHHEVTLQDISERFFLSREYISRKFKQEIGENVFDYLARVRVGKAKELLLSPHLKIGQIAGMVGYDDEKYFSKVFKKIAGQSPNQYRKQQEG